MLKETTAAIRKIEISETKFQTPNAENQMYFSGIQDLVIRQAEFNETVDSQAPEGASMYCDNVYALTVLQSQFIG
jgi:hypothetical protein